MLRLRIRAPFAAFRRFTAGAFRPTMPAPPPSALYGLVLNLAGIESRLDDGKSEMSLTKAGLPRCVLAAGLVSRPETALLFQQLHNYPVGDNTKKEEQEGPRRNKSAGAKGNKYNIQPVRREFLVDIDLRLWVNENLDLESRARRGIERGTEYASEEILRYGLPFLGDNNLFLDTLTEENLGPNAEWVEQAPLGITQAGKRLFRLTTWIDRKDMTRTKSSLFGLSAPSAEPPEAAWVRIEPPG